MLEIRDSAVASYHFANALNHLGRYVDARERLQRVLNDPSANAEIRAAANELFPTVDHSIGRLTLRLVSERGGIRILINGREASLVALDVPVPVDPGEVKVVALRDGEEVASSTARVGGDAGLQVEVVLQITVRDQPSATDAIAPTFVTLPDSESPSRLATIPSARDEDDDSGLLGQWWFWTAIGVVGAGAAVTVIALSSGGTEPADLSVVHGDFEPGLLEGRVQ